jgi:adenylosuccinate lyase
MSIFSISPIDGRYLDKVDPYLRELWSEFGLIRTKIFIEVRWFLHLCQDTHINSPSLTDTQEHFLDSLHEEFDHDAALEVKKLEKVTNHDVKSVELYISQRMKDSGLFPNNTESWVHFSCTSEDITNLAYATRLRVTRNILVQSLEKLH